MMMMFYFIENNYNNNNMSDPYQNAFYIFTWKDISSSLSVA